jgi:uncharacterized protein with HEPN domain
MTRRDDRITLRQMLDFAEEAMAAARGRTRSDLDSDRQFFLAVTHLLEWAGEAPRRLTEDIRSAHPEIPWQDISGMRNWLAHGYDAIDMDRVWDTMTHDLPELVRSLRSILSKLPRA